MLGDITGVFAPFLAQVGRTAFLAVLVILMKCSFQRQETTWNNSYDYVIIGGGTAGCVLANRLSEDPFTSVLLIESGPEENFASDIPVLSSYLRNSDMDWGIFSEPQKYANQESTDHRMGLFQGRVLGGTSVINAMLYVRGANTDYNKWSALGVTGWNYKSNLKYFKKSEGTLVPKHRIDEVYHGTSGPVRVTLPRFERGLGAAFQRAGASLGHESFLDYNGESAIGFASPQSTIYEGKRMSAAKAYIEPIFRKRRNLKILTFTTVTKINFSSRIKNRAIGVTFKRELDGRSYFVRANKEVILSAGALQTPKLLMLSGIGDCGQLKNKFNINCRSNRPNVGQNLMDHIGAGSMIFTVNHTKITSSVRDINPVSFFQYVTSSKGPLTSSLVDGLAFLPLGSASSPNIELILCSATLLSDYGSTLKRAEIMTEELWSEYKKYSGLDSFAIFPVLLTPKSRGFVTLKNLDPLSPPLVTMNHLQSSYDVESIKNGMKFIMRLIKQPDLARLGTKLVPVRFPRCPNAKIGSDEYFRCALKSYTVSYWHFSGTARMGQVNDTLAVVDNRLRVIGVSGLRVVDASVMPVVTTGHLQAAVYMIAEKAADMIKGKI